MKLKLKVGSFKKPERKEWKILHPVNLKIAQAGKMAIWGEKSSKIIFKSGKLQVVLIAMVAVESWKSLL